MMENTCYLLGIDMFQHIAKGYPCWGYDLFMILPLLFVTLIVFCWIFIFAQMFIQKDENVRKIPLKKWISLIVLTVFCFLLIAFEVTVIKVKHDNSADLLSEENTCYFEFVLDPWWKVFKKSFISK